MCCRHAECDRFTVTVTHTHARHTQKPNVPQSALNSTQQIPVSDPVLSLWSKVTLLTSKVISRTFLGICMMPESPSSPDTHTQGLEVVMALLSFLMGMITTLYGITAGEQNMSAPEQRNKHQHANVRLANWVSLWNHRFRANTLQQRRNRITDHTAQQQRPEITTETNTVHVCLSAVINLNERFSWSVCKHRDE